MRFNFNAGIRNTTDCAFYHMYQKKAHRQEAMWKNVFPDYAVKQAFHEADLKIGDELIITAMQSDLLTRCLMSVLKGAVVHCSHKKRKFISEKDVEIGRCLSIFPTQDPDGCGLLLDPAHFIHIVQDHLQLCMTHISKLTGLVQETRYRLSQETMNKLQSEVEAAIRGFLARMGLQRRIVTLRQFEITMGKILGDPTYVTSDRVYTHY